MEDFEGEVVKNKCITKDFFLIEFRLKKPLTEVEPGQFVMLKIPGEGVFLRRPFSIYDFDTDTISILYRVKGKGTYILSMVKEGEKTKLLAPLGRGFNLNIGENVKPVVIAGGIGIAGVNLLIKRLKDPDIFYGCADRKEKRLIDNIKVKNILIATMDGSVGFKGDIISLFETCIKRYEKDIYIYACGPEGMYKSLRESLKHKVSCEVLLEERMACGLGLCFGCVKRTLDERDPYKRVCKEGPVFDLWQISL